MWSQVVYCWFHTLSTWLQAVSRQIPHLQKVNICSTIDASVACASKNRQLSVQVNNIRTPLQCERASSLEQQNFITYVSLVWVWSHNTLLHRRMKLYITNNILYLISLQFTSNSLFCMAMNEYNWNHN